jgi:caffeoyl-CoA O-methyltransferase
MNHQLVTDYISELFARQDPALIRAWEESPKKGLPAISIQPEEGRFLQLLVRACGTKLALEIGTLGGYSGIWIARGLVEGGKLVTLERDSLHADVAREHFALAGVADRVDLRLGDAQGWLPRLVAEGPFDFVFIDADKPGYPAYFTWALENTRLGGVIAAHNALRGGKVAEPGEHDENTRIIRSLNLQVAGDPRLISTIHPGGDGMLVAVKIA